MLRNEIQRKTGLTRKAIEYYEEKGLIKPQKSENGYREYSKEDLEVLTKISLFRKIGVSIAEIDDYLSSNGNSLSSILRKKQHQLYLEEKRMAVIQLIAKGEAQELINNKIAVIEAEESIYERLLRAFPGYFGQMLFAAYQPFLCDPLEQDGQEAYAKYVDYLDALPPLKLSKAEQYYIDNVSANFDMNTLKDVNKAKVEAVKNSEEYQNSLMKQIQDKLQKFMLDNKYYEIAIPLIRKFSKSYNAYYEKLLEANNNYFNIIK